MAQWAFARTQLSHRTFNLIKFLTRTKRENTVSHNFIGYVPLASKRRMHLEYAGLTFVALVAFFPFALKKFIKTLSFRARVWISGSGIPVVVLTCELVARFPWFSFSTHSYWYFFHSHNAREPQSLGYKQINRRMDSMSDAYLSDWPQ